MREHKITTWDAVHSEVFASGIYGVGAALFALGARHEVIAGHCPIIFAPAVVLCSVYAASYIMEAGRNLSELPSINARRPFDDIRLVGERKLLGYCSLDDMIKKGGDGHPQALQKEAEEKGLETFVLDEDEDNAHSGTLFVYDPLKLQDYLLIPQNKAILEDYNWPSDANAFARKVSVDSGHKGALYDLIAFTFNDPRPEYQNFLKYSGCPAIPDYFEAGEQIFFGMNIPKPALRAVFRRLTGANI